MVNFVMKMCLMKLVGKYNGLYVGIIGIIVDNDIFIFSLSILDVYEECGG